MGVVVVDLQGGVGEQGTGLRGRQAHAPIPCGGVPGGAVGLLLGGVLTEYLDWRWCMYVNLAFAVVALVGGARLLHGGRPADRP